MVPGDGLRRERIPLRSSSVRAEESLSPAIRLVGRRDRARILTSGGDRYEGVAAQYRNRHVAPRLRTVADLTELVEAPAVRLAELRECARMEHIGVDRDEGAAAHDRCRSGSVGQSAIAKLTVLVT